MKQQKIFLLVALCITCILAGCAKHAKQDVSLDYVADEIKKTAEITEMKEEKIDSMTAAKRYGISTDMLEAGVALSSYNDNVADEIIILKAKDSKSVLDLERSMQREIEALSKAWESNEQQYEIVQEHIVKTSGKFVILVISNRVDEVEKAFDRVTSA